MDSLDFDAALQGPALAWLRGVATMFFTSSV
jgi:hypothetical protein